MTFDRELLSDFTEERSDVFLGDDGVLPGIGKGVARVPVYDVSGVTNLTLHDVLYVPDLKKNLFSVPAVTKRGAVVQFDHEKCALSKDGKYFNVGHKVGDKLYKLNNKPEYATLSYENPSSLELWHQRLCHLNYYSVSQLSKGDIATGVNCNVGKADMSNNCEPCILGKMHKAPFPKLSSC